MATVIGIDLGSHSVKLSVMTGRLGRLEPEGYQEHLVHGEVPGAPTLEERVATLGAVVGKLGDAQTTTWSLAVPGEEVSLRVVRLPFTDRGQIDKTLGFELEGFVPFDVDSYLLDYRVLGNDDEGGSLVLCALASQERLGALLSLLAEHGVDPRHLTLDVDTLGGLADGEGVQAVVDLGHSRTLVSVCQAGAVMGGRAISGGGAQITQALSEALGLDFAEAEALKLRARLSAGAGLPGPAAPQLVEAEWDEEDNTAPRQMPSPVAPAPAVEPQVDRAADALIGQLRASLIALEDELGVGVDELLLVGGTASLEGLPERIGEQLGVPTRRVNPAVEAGSDGPWRFGLVHTLALRGAGMTRGQELQFRKEAFAFKGDMALLNSLLGYAAVALLFFTLVGAVLFAVRFVQYGQQIAETEQQVTQVVLDTFIDVDPSLVDSPTMARAVMMERTTETLAQVEALGSTLNGEPFVLGLLNDVSGSVPPHTDAVIDVKDFTVSEGSLTFEAETDGYESAGVIEAALKRNPRFKQAQKGNEKKQGAKVVFTMTIPLDQGEEGEES